MVKFKKGDKVSIPTRKTLVETGYSDYDQFLRRIEGAKYTKPYLVIDEVISHNGAIRLVGDGQNLRYSPIFHPNDLQIYSEVSEVYELW